VQQARASIVAARAARRAARAPYLPTLTASYGRNMNELSQGFSIYPGDPNFTGSFRFQLSYPLFNQYAREETVIRAEVAEVTAEAQLRDVQLASRQSLVQFLGQLRTAQQRIAIQADAVLAAQEDLRIQRQRYELGASTLLDVLTSQTQLGNARVALIQARLDARLAQAQIEALIGRDLGATP
jgi:outer membrane protein